MAFSDPPHSGLGVREPRILLVDDDPTVLRALRRLLLGARPGWQIDVASNAESALLLLATTTYDVAVTDLHMPNLDGMALLARLKTEHPSVMRVIHSSQTESLSAEQTQDLVHAVLAKPGRPGELVAVLDWAIDQRRRLRDNVAH
jgi:DNA-binding NtrC family response regulator